MMGGSERVFYIVDVFAERKFAGNQLAVFLNGHLYSDREMLQLTRGMNFAESTFIFPDKSVGNRYKVRIFTPTEEVPFAGHPVLGTAYIISQEMKSATKLNEIILDLKAGEIPVTLKYDTNNQVEFLEMKQLQPAFGETLSFEKIANVLGLHVSDFDERYPIEEVSTGLSFIIAPVKTLEAMNRIRLQTALYLELIGKLSSKTLVAFAPEAFEPSHALNVRVLGDYYGGPPEDPATGSANGCLTGYLLKHRIFGDVFQLKAEQGYQIDRPSVLSLRGEIRAGKYDIYIGGQVVPIAKGHLL